MSDTNVVHLAAHAGSAHREESALLQYVSPDGDTFLFLVDATLGAHPDRISRAVAAALKQSANVPGDPADRLRDGLRIAHHAIQDQSHEPPYPGAAAVGVCIRGTMGWIASVGHCSCFLLRDKEIMHRTLPAATVLGGAPDRPVPEIRAVGPWLLEQSDRLLLAAHSISNILSDTDLSTLMANKPPERCVESLLKLANHRKVRDEALMMVAAFQDPTQATLQDEYAEKALEEARNPSNPTVSELDVQNMLASLKEEQKEVSVRSRAMPTDEATDEAPASSPWPMAVGAVIVLGILAVILVLVVI